MSRTLNLGILAHVDAGKTTLTERLLYAAGVIDRLGSVDSGTTQTDSLALERARGITIRSAVASLRIGDRDVNIIDTPGHPDFIAEVDRVLAVLDGAVLVVSAVEGVQPQTRLLMRALRRLGVPTLIFVNKVDRGGADLDRVLEQIERRLAVPAVPMCGVRGAGTRSARVEPDDERVIDVLTTRDDGLLAAYLSDSASLEPQRLRSVLADLTASRHAVPVFAGSAITGAGIADLMGGLADLLPTAAGDPAAPASGRIFKVERGRAGEKIAYLRMFDGVLRLRDHPTGGRDRITGLAMLDRGGWRPRPQVEAGQIARVHGLAGSRVGDLVGDLVVTPRSSSGPAPPRRRLAAFSSVERRPGIPPSSALRGIHLDDAGPSTNFWAQPPVGVAASAHGGSVGQFAPPMLEALVVPLDPHEGAKLRTALTQLGEQDPLINVRADEVGTAVSLFGEVQKEVIGATLAEEFGLAVRFEETTALCVERPAGVGEAIERLNTPTNPHQATIGLRIEPGPADSGIDVRIEVDYRSVPLYAYRTVEIFTDYLDGYVREALQTGPSGWPVTDCVVTLTESGYSVADGPPSLRGPTTTTADVRKLTALVLADAVADAGTVVCEPLARVSLDIPAGSLSAVLGALSRLAAVVEDQLPHGEEMLVVGVLTAADSQRLHRMLPGLTGGEGVLESTFAGYRPVRGRPRVRR